MELTELIAKAPWREAVTYRDSWPHQYVLLRKDRQRDLLAAVRARMLAGEGVTGQFFGYTKPYLFIGDYKYWFMTPCDRIDLDGDSEYVLNRAVLYRDRRDFTIQAGDTGRRQDYPVTPARARVLHSPDRPPSAEAQAAPALSPEREGR